MTRIVGLVLTLALFVHLGPANAAEALYATLNGIAMKDPNADCTAALTTETSAASRSELLYSLWFPAPAMRIAFTDNFSVARRNSAKHDRHSRIQIVLHRSLR
jgi:hypothetical protein